MRNPRPAIGYPPPPPTARPTVPAPLAARPAPLAARPAPAPLVRQQGGDPIWADAWRESPAVEQTLARLTDALSRDQRIAGPPRVAQPSANKRARHSGLRASRVAAVSAVALLAALSGLSLAYGWRADGPGISALLSGFAPVSNSPEAIPVVAERDAAVDGVADAKAEEDQVASLAPAEGTETVEVERGKTIATTKLMVFDASGEALHYIPLSISTDSAAGADKLAIRLTGLPTETVLTSGEDLGNGSWLLKPGEERDLKLAVQSSAPREILIGVEAIEMKTGELAAPPQDLRVKVLPPRLFVQPAADTIKPAIVPEAEPSDLKPAAAAAKIVPAPELPALPGVDNSEPELELKIASIVPQSEAPAAAPQAEPQAELKVAAVDPLIVSTVGPSAAADTPAPAGGADSGLTSRGDSLMAMGEVIGARSFYSRAYGRGDAAAARNIARTFDPVVYAELNVIGLKPNAEKALEWYRKAAASGVSAAASDIAALEAYLASR